VEADLVVLATGMDPRGNGELTLPVVRDGDGFAVDERTARISLQAWRGDRRTWRRPFVTRREPRPRR
jgi:hypothetical protein